ncbi:MAG: hypothetical protein NZ519_02850 [Bacteroidia bacterium]|nr:hypothetical protein [Bacteroidia bacterium]
MQKNLTATANTGLYHLLFYFFGRALAHTSLRWYGQGRRASGYANASVLRCAPHWANAHPPHASRKGSLKNPFLCILCKVLACK